MQRPSDTIQKAILGCLLLFPEELDTVTGIIGESEFISEKYRAVFCAICDNPGADTVAIAPKLSGVTTMAELVEWTSEEFTASLLPRYCRELKELATKEKIWRIATEIRNNAEVMTSTELMEVAEKGFASIATMSKAEPQSMRALCLQSMKVLEERYRADENQVQGIPYGLPELDQLTGGMHRGEMVVVAGRPSMGKSAFVGNILEHGAMRGHKGLSFSLEMSALSCMDRLFASNSQVSLTRLRNGRMQDADWAKLSGSFNRVANFPLWIDDTPGISLQEVKSKARNAKRNTGLDLLAVDYLTLMQMEGKRGDSRAREVGEVSRSLKNLARELDLTLLLVCQINRGVDSRQDKRPVMSDLRDSGEIEQDADVILFPFRPAAYCEKCKDKVVDADHDYRLHESQAEIILEKQRNGPRNVSVKCRWSGEFQQFTEKEEVYYE